MAASLKADTAGRSSEPSMEEILASIRKIISDESTKPAAPARPAPMPVAVPPEPPAASGPQSQDDIDALMAGFDSIPDAGNDDNVLELTEEMAAVEEPAEAHAPPTLRAVPDEPVWSESEPEFEAAPPPAPPRAAAPSPAPAPVEVASFPDVRAAAPQPPRFEDRLLSTATDHAISSAFGKLTHTILAQNARTLDDLVQDMLRPMLKTWLDDNLPDLVERLVRSEIERVSRGSR